MSFRGALVGLFSGLFICTAIGLGIFVLSLVQAAWGIEGVLATLFVCLIGAFTLIGAVTH